ncbi:MAG: serine/threonine protein kinase [Deltaproteobacteria bacterium]|nr:serine/threonine protein kinase [Deltaproteobacteria bacterium]MDQ3299514.1 protein kinase [Myxococcota bacterium]
MPGANGRFAGDRIGETLGNYRIISEIGQGGMGVVYLAEHTLLGRKAAVKLLRNDVAAELVERFFTEARAAATLRHPGLVDVYDYGHDAGGSYIVMEFLGGESLAERLEHEPRLPLPLACAITRSVANAIHVAHDLGIVHRDLKPANIFLVPDAEASSGVRPKVLDFGIAKLMRDREPRSVQTHSGALIGTPRYMSPEQCKSARSVDGRADIYSLGCIFYEMLLGAAPFAYDTWAELVAAHLHEQPRRPIDVDPTLPPAVDALLVKMLQKRPEDRPGSMEELSQALEVVLRETGGAPTRMTPAAGLKRPISRDVASMDPTLPAAALAAPTIVSSRPPSVVAAPPEPGPRRSTGVPWIAIAIGFATVVAAVLVVFTLRERGEPPPEATVIVQQQMVSTAPEHPRVPVDAASAPTGEPTSVIDAGTRVPIRTSTELDGAQLERMFARQRPQLASCFRAHPGESRDQQLSMRFQINTAGKVVSAEVLPATVASTALGTCLANVARATAFGPQPRGATFRIPINVGG